MNLAHLGAAALLSATALGCSSSSGAPAAAVGGDAGSDASMSGPDDASMPGEASADTGIVGEPSDAGTSTEAGGKTDAGSGPATSGHTPAGVPLPAGWTLKQWDKFGTGPSSTVTNNTELHAKYYEAQFYNRDAQGLVTIPNTVINMEQETYVHFETAIGWSTDHLAIQARGQMDGSITSGEMVSIYTARSFCTEAKYQIPKPMGSWPAFWFYSATSGGDKSEIDVEQPVTPNQGVSSVSMYNHPGRPTSSSPTRRSRRST